MIGDYPIFGVGPRAWPAVRAGFLHELKFLPRFPHNAYLRAAAEMGIPGLLLFCIALLLTFIPLWKAAFDPNAPVLSCGIAAGLTALFIHMAFDFDAAFIGILLPAALLAALGNRMALSDAQPRRLGRWRLPLIAISSVLIVILLLRAISDQSYSVAAAAAENGDLDAAKSDARLAAALDPLAWKPRHLLYNIYASAGDNERALASMEAAIRRAPTVPELHHSRALAALASGDSATAVSEYNFAIELAPRGSPEVYLQLATLQKKLGNIDRAEGVLLAGIDALFPFTGDYYTAPTSGFRYRSAVAWERLGDIWRDRGDSTMAAIADYNAATLRIPRKTDAPARLLALETPSPEMTVVRVFMAMNSGDTAVVRSLTTYKSGVLPHFPAGLSISVEKILDVREEPLEGLAKVDVILHHVKESGAEKTAKSTIDLVMSDGHWIVKFGGE